jgi:outer membrane protein TolC
MAATVRVPIFDGGRTAARRIEAQSEVRQREAEYRRDVTALEQLRTKTAAQVKAALVKWKQTRQFVDATAARAAPVKAQVERMQHLFEAGQTDVMKLLQVRQRLIDAQGAQLDAVWQATQAYADLLTAVGTGPLLNSAAKQPEMLPLPPSPD